MHSFLSGVSMNPYGALSVLVKKYKLPNSIKKFIFSRSDFEIGESFTSLDSNSRTLCDNVHIVLFINFTACLVLQDHKI